MLKHSHCPQPSSTLCEDSHSHTIQSTTVVPFRRGSVSGMLRLTELIPRSYSDQQTFSGQGVETGTRDDRQRRMQVSQSSWTFALWSCAIVYLYELVVRATLDACSSVVCTSGFEKKKKKGRRDSLLASVTVDTMRTRLANPARASRVAGRAWEQPKLELAVTFS